MTVVEIEIPKNCPLCHKFVGNDVFHVVLPNNTVACIHCWHLVQEEALRAMYELTDWLVSLRKGWHWLKARCRWGYWLEDRKRWRKIAERHLSVYSVVDAEIPADVA